jgi:hypothetical protein
MQKDEFLVIMTVIMFIFLVGALLIRYGIWVP